MCLGAVPFLFGVFVELKTVSLPQVRYGHANDDDADDARHDAGHDAGHDARNDAGDDDVGPLQRNARLLAWLFVNAGHVWSQCDRLRAGAHAR